jgi:transcriptional regulator with XRE-family HTH domain
MSIILNDIEISAPPSDDDPTVGQRLKSLREMFGLSQRELARRADVTNGTISLIEQGEVSPSIASLKKVLSGFPMPLADFFSPVLVTEQPKFFPRAELTVIADGDVRYCQVGRDLKDSALQMLHEEYAPGADTGKEMLSHAGEESGMVVAGQIEITVGGKTFLVGPGDAYYFNCRLPHRFRNRGKVACVLISACTPPTF